MFYKLLLLLIILSTTAIGNVTPTPEGVGDNVFKNCATKELSDWLTFQFVNGPLEQYQDQQLIDLFIQEIPDNTIDPEIAEFLRLRKILLPLANFWFGESLRVDVYILSSPISSEWSFIAYITNNMEEQDYACGIWEFARGSFSEFDEYLMEIRKSLPPSSGS